MAEDKTFTKAEVDAAIKAAVDKVQESITALEAKNEELVGEVRTAKAEARKAKAIDPADVDKLHAQVDELQGKLTAAEKAAKDTAKALTAAEKALETEQGAARSYALDAEISSAIAQGNVVPALVPGFKAMVMANAKAELVDGKYAVTYGDKPAAEAIKTLLDSEDGKAWRAAPANGGGGAPGSTTTKGSGKQIARADFDTMDQGARAAFFKDGGTIADTAA